MSSSTTKEELIAAIEQLNDDQQAHLLTVARLIQASPLPPGTSGDDLLAMQDRFQFAPGEVDDMVHIIEEGCENIDWDDWR